MPALVTIRVDGKWVWTVNSDMLKGGRNLTQQDKAMKYALVYASLNNIMPIW